MLARWYFGFREFFWYSCREDHWKLCRRHQNVNTFTDLDWREHNMTTQTKLPTKISIIFSPDEIYTIWYNEGGKPSNYRLAWLVFRSHSCTRLTYFTVIASFRLQSAKINLQRRLFVASTVKINWFFLCVSLRFNCSIDTFLSIFLNRNMYSTLASDYIYRLKWSIVGLNFVRLKQKFIIDFP